MSRIVRVAVVQDAPVAFDREATFRKAVHLLQQAAAGNVGLVVFPEAFLGGYPKGLDFGVRLGSRSNNGRVWFARYADAAIGRDSSEMHAFLQVVRECGVHCVMGLIERAAGTLYCVAATISPDGVILSWRRKLMPTALERVVWGQGDGSTLHVAESSVGRIGAAICWENYMPLLRMTLYSDNVELYCTPTVDDRLVWTSTIQHIALEGRCFVINASQFAERSDYPLDYPIDSLPATTSDNVLIRGGSCVIGPLGQFLVEPVRDRKTILFAECDLDLIPQAKMDLDVVGHYARPDIFSLTVNRSPQATLFCGSAGETAQQGSDPHSTSDAK